MGSYDGAESCELVGTYLLSEISSVIDKKSIGLYRDDGLAIVHMSPQEAENTKKQLCEKFNQYVLQITANANETVVDYLDMTFDIQRKEYKPYTKPCNHLLYVNTQSNHPSHVIKTIPQSVQSRLSTISSNEKIFDEAKGQYENALHTAGYKDKLNFKPNTGDAQNQTQQKRRSRNITWFNPPYSSSVKSNIGKKIISLIVHFPREHPLHKICNRNTLKISYSSMDNMEKLTKAHNNKLINKNNNHTTQPRCNCRNKDDCPLPGKCTSQNIVYQATVTSQNEEKIYVGLTSNTFKTRYSAHKNSFIHPEKKHQTELSTHIWKLKDNNIPHSINWKIIKHARPYSPRTKRCNLCLWEKCYIIISDKQKNFKL